MNQNFALYDELQEKLFLLRGELCWGVVGPSAGSMFSMDFGAKHPRKYPVNNPHLSEDCRIYKAAYRIFVQMAPWLILKNGVLLCDQSMSNKPGGEMQNTFPLLEGLIVQECRLRVFPFKFTVMLADGYKVVIGYWDMKFANPEYTLFSIRIHNVYYAVSETLVLKKSFSQESS